MDVSRWVHVKGLWQRIAAADDVGGYTRFSETQDANVSESLAPRAAPSQFWDDLGDTDSSDGSSSDKTSDKCVADAGGEALNCASFSSDNDGQATRTGFVASQSNSIHQQKVKVFPEEVPLEELHMLEFNVEVSVSQGTPPCFATPSWTLHAEQSRVCT